MLAGKKYAFRSEADVTEVPGFKGALFAGTGVIRDGDVLTSGVCPFAARRDGTQDGTEELIQTLVEAIGGKE